MNAMHLFKNKRIMFIDGKGLLTAACRRRLVYAGATIVGPVSSVGEAKAALNGWKIDAAVLDLRTDDHMIVTLADDLEALDIPFVFATKDVSPLDGFVLHEDEVELSKIAEALFLARVSHTLH